MIFGQPKDWRDLQDKVAQIFTECGCIARVEKTLTSPRGPVEIDVAVVDIDLHHPLTYVCECKYWHRPVPKNVIHSFRSVVQEIGANVGYVISRAGFQKGAKEAATATNIHLVSWEEFQELLLQRWATSWYEAMRPPFEYIARLYDQCMQAYHDFEEIPLQREFARLGEKFDILAAMEWYCYNLDCTCLPTSMTLPHRVTDRFGPSDSGVVYHDYSSMFRGHLMTVVQSLQDLGNAVDFNDYIPGPRRISQNVI